MNKFNKVTSAVVIVGLTKSVANHYLDDNDNDKGAGVN